MHDFQEINKRILEKLESLHTKVNQNTLTVNQNTLALERIDEQISGKKAQSYLKDNAVFYTQVYGLIREHILTME
jgi:hypothetical protein